MKNTKILTQEVVDSSTIWRDPHNELPEHGKVIQIRTIDTVAFQRMGGTFYGDAVYNEVSQSFIIMGKSHTVDSGVVQAWRYHPDIEHLMY